MLFTVSAHVFWRRIDLEVLRVEPAGVGGGI